MKFYDIIRKNGGGIMEYIKNLLKKTGWISLVESVIFAIIGLILICNPEQSIQVIYTILGIIFISLKSSPIFFCVCPNLLSII